ncbi:LLM class flavin-dependent oxidoreductase, partial [Rhizobium ruizarguesonis]
CIRLQEPAAGRLALSGNCVIDDVLLAVALAPFWHPIKLAGEAAMADIICDGRLDIGIARGAYSFEYESLLPGLDAWGAGQRMRELIPAVKGI